jgi:UDPglucose 6-dehydrogenase
MNKPLIGFIGQGWIGKNYADDFERRGYSVVRYGLEEPYIQNKEQISLCDIVFIAVPTPTTEKGFDDSAIHAVLPLVGKGKIAVIKSTLLIGRTNTYQNTYTHCTIFHSPEFLSERTAAHDAAHPDRNIVGIPENSSALHKQYAQTVLDVLPKAPFNKICSSREAEFIKYAHNIHGYIQVVFSNILYDIAGSAGMSWDNVREILMADPMMSHRYLNPLDGKGRGAGGHCFIKDFEAFIEFARGVLPDKKALLMLESIRNKNIDLLVKSGKDIDLVKGVYGDIQI